MTAAGEAAAAYVVDAPLTPPSDRTGLLGVFRRRYLLRLLVRRELMARYSGSVLGLLWSYLNPLAHFFIYYFVMGVLFNLHKDTENFAIHLFAGLIIVHFFAETLNAGTRSIVRNRSLVQKMALPREMFPVASMLVSAYHAIPQIAIMGFFCVLLGWYPDPVGVAAGLLGSAIVIVLGTALALFFSVANVFLRDVSNAVSVLTMFIRFSVPMMYPYTMVAERFHGHVDLYLANPIAIAVLLYQRCFWLGTTSNPDILAVTDFPNDLYLRGVIALLISVALLVIAQLVFWRHDRRIPESL